MSDDPALPPFIYEGLYPAEDRKCAIEAFAGLVTRAAKQLSDARNPDASRECRSVS